MNINLQSGVALRREERELRAAIEFYDGRAPLGEYFQSDERYLGTGIWVDI